MNDTLFEYLKDLPNRQKVANSIKESIDISTFVNGAHIETFIFDYYESESVQLKHIDYVGTGESFFELKAILPNSGDLQMSYIRINKENGIRNIGLSSRNFEKVYDVLIEIEKGLIRKNNINKLI